MAFPPDVLATDYTDDSPATPNVHADMHNVVNDAVNETVAEVVVLDAAITAETAARTAADALAIPLTQKAAPNGVASLGSDGFVPISQLSATLINETHVVGSQAAMLASGGHKGDIAIRTDQNKTYVLAGTDATILGNWTELPTPTDAVSSVNGQQGAVSLAASDVGAVPAATYDANSILKADSDNTPVALAMGASTILARLASGGIVAATPAQLKTLLAVAYADVAGLGTAAQQASTAFDAAGAADAKVAQTITNGVTTSAPSQDAVFDALALKQNAGTSVPLAGGTMTGELVVPDLNVTSGISGFAQGRFFGFKTTTGPPSSGAWVAGDYCIDSDGQMWTCTTGGTPGTWKSGNSGRLLGQTKVTTYSAVATSGSATDAAGLVVAVTTTGRPLTLKATMPAITIVPSTTAGTARGRIAILEGSTTIVLKDGPSCAVASSFQEGGLSVDITLDGADIPSVGSHTYKVQFYHQGAVSSGSYSSGATFPAVIAAIEN